MSLKKGFPGLHFAYKDYAIVPQEIDRYEQYIVAFPSLNAKWFGTSAVSGTADTKALVVINAIADYPRNLEWSLAGSHDAINGTCIVNGNDQFGQSISETFTFAKASLGGTVVGTKVFAQVKSGTTYFGTYAGNGTSQVGVGTTGTTTKFGLPFKIGGTGDVKNIAWQNGTGAVTVNGGTIGAFVDATYHAIKAPTTIAGTMIMSVIAKTTYDPESHQGLGLMAAGTQI